MALDRFMLEKDDAVLLIIDIQDRLAAVMKERERVVKNCLHLIELATMMNIPIVVTEQYPKGLGATLPELREALPGYRPVEKTAFNSCGEPAFLSEVEKHGKKKIIVTGMETHICVLQTTIGLLQRGYMPHVVQDAVCSRGEENWRTGLEFVRDAGATVTGTETVLFQILKVAGTEEFKTISKRIK